MKWLLALLAALFLVAGCNKGGTNQNSTDLRALNVVVDAEPLDVLVDNDVKFAAVASGATTDFTNFDSGTRKLQPAPNDRTRLEGQGAVERAPGMNAIPFTFRCDFEPRSGKVMRIETSE